MTWTSYIKTTNPIELVSALRQVCEQSEDWQALPPIDTDSTIGAGAFLAADYIGTISSGQDLGFCAIAWPNKTDRVSIAMQASRWANDASFPATDEYARAEDLVRPLIAAAGRMLGERLRLSRASDKGIRPIRGKLAERLRCVTGIYEMTRSHEVVRALHPNDKRRFWQFIQLAHQYRSVVRPCDVAFHLRAAGFASELVTRLQLEYEIGRQVLAAHPAPWDLRGTRRQASAA